MSVRTAYAAFTSPHHDLVAMMPELRSLRSALLAIRDTTSIESAINLFTLASLWYEDKRLTNLIADYQKANRRRWFDEVLVKLSALHECFNEAREGGVLVKFRDGSGVIQPGFVISVELRDMIKGLIGDIELLLDAGKA